MHRTTVETRDGRVIVETGDITTVFRSGSDRAAAEQIAILQEQYLMWQERVAELDRKVEACRRYLDHCQRVTLPRRASDSGEMGVRQSLKREAMRECGLIQ